MKKLLLFFGGIAILGGTIAAVSIAMRNAELEREARLKAAVRSALRSKTDLMGDAGLSTAEPANAKKPELAGVLRDAEFRRKGAADLTTALNWSAQQNARIREVMAKIHAEGDAIPLAKVLEPANVISADRLTDGKRILKRFGEYITHYDRTLESERERMEREVETLALDKHFKIGFVRGIKERHREGRQLTKEFVDVEILLLGKMSEILDFMFSRLGTATVEDGGLLFETDEDAERYNRMVADLDELSKREAAAMNRILESERKGVTQLDAFSRELERK